MQCECIYVSLKEKNTGTKNKTAQLVSDKTSEYNLIDSYRYLTRWKAAKNVI